MGTVESDRLVKVADVASKSMSPKSKAADVINFDKTWFISYDSVQIQY